MITENLSTLKIHKLTKAQYERELAAGRIDPTALYLTPDEDVDLSGYATKEDLNGKANKTHTHNISDVTNLQSTLDSNLETAKSYTDTKTTNMATTSSVNTAISTHNTSTSAHSDIRTALNNKADSSALNNYYTKAQTDTEIEEAKTAVKNDLLNGAGTAYDTLKELGDLIVENEDAIEALETIAANKVNKTDIVDNLTTSDATKALSAKQGVALKTLVDTSLEESKGYTDEIIGTTIEEFGAGFEEVIRHMYGGTWVGDDMPPTIPDIVNDATNSVLEESKGYTDELSMAFDEVIMYMYSDIISELPEGASIPTIAQIAQLVHQNMGGVSDEQLEGKADKEHEHAIADVNGLQTALDGKQATITGAASTITSDNLTTNRALISNGSGKVAVSDITSTELGYLDGVTSNVQTQLDTLTSEKVSKSGDTMTGDLTIKADFGSVRFNDAGGNKMSVLQASNNDHTTSIYAYPTDKSTYYERYDLPTPSTGRTSNKAYKIFTSKDVTASAAELNFVEGVTHSIQTQLNDRFKKSDVIPIANGGTNATDVAGARTNLGLDKSITLESVEVTLPKSSTWVKACYGNGKFVVVATSGNTALYSTDGITWNESTLPASGTWRCLAFGNGVFVAIAHDSTNAAYSYDGITWTATTMPLSVSWFDVAFGNGIFVATSSGMDAAYSTDGIIWNSMLLPINLCYNITYGKDKFVVISYNGDDTAYSFDGITWNTSEMPSSGSWNDVVYGNGKFVAVKTDSTDAAYSTDGITWTATTMPSSLEWEGIAYDSGNNVFVAVAYSSNVAAYSYDGITWIATTMPSTEYWRVAVYGGGRLIAIEFSGRAIAFSNDGVNWSTSVQVLKDVNDTDITKTVKNALGVSNDIDIDNAVLITVDAIDAICGTVIEVADEVTF